MISINNKALFYRTKSWGYLLTLEFTQLYDITCFLEQHTKQRIVYKTNDELDLQKNTSYELIIKTIILGWIQVWECQLSLIQ